MVDPRKSSEAAAHPAEAEPASRVGTTIRGKWRVDALIGTGGMASVYAATHRNGQRAALKILHAALSNESSIRDRFLREGYVANSVNHVGCVAVLDDDSTEEDAPFLIMELLEGETLSRRWKKLSKRMSVGEALRIADPVLDCLHACHAAGVIHRDLKPPNIFITEDGRVKVLDFGVAQLRDATAEKTRTGTALGTPYYMSPEQAMGLVDQLDGRADLFSVGAILHALITGQRIHNARTENEALILAATTPVPSVARIAPDLPVEVIKLIDKALAWDRRNRYENARDMQLAAQQTLASVEGTAMPAAIGALPSSAAHAVSPDAYAAQQQLIAQQLAPQPAAPQPAAPPPAPRQEEIADESDPRVEEARDLFKHFDRLLPTVRQIGWGHPATERAIRTAYDAFAAALAKNPNAVSLKIRPYSFLHLGHTAWEPSAPFDTVPYNLFAAGMRSLRFDNGLTLDEFHSVVELLLLDPGRDLPPEDDIVSAFWDKGCEHVQYETTDPFAEGDGRQRERFLDEADQLEAVATESATKANRLEARAMAVSTNRAALHAAGIASPMAIDHAMRVAFEPQMMIGRPEWSERYVEVLVDGLRDAITEGDARHVYKSLQRSSSDLVVAGRLSVALDLHGAIVRRLKQSQPGIDAREAIGELTDSMFGGDTLKLLLDRLRAEPESVESIRPILETLSANELGTVLTAMQIPLAEPIRKLLLAFVERCASGNEIVIADAIGGLDPLVLFPILETLGRLRTPEARKAIANLTTSKDIAVRIEAKILAAGRPEAVQDEIDKLANDKSIGVRIASLRAIARHGLKRVLPTVTRRIQTAVFNTLVLEERRELFMTVLALAPDRGEELALEIAKKGGLFTNDSREVSRSAAIEALGAASRSKAVADALRQIGQSRWATSDDTRNKAAAAADQIEARAGQSPVSGGTI